MKPYLRWAIIGVAALTIGATAPPRSPAYDLLVRGGRIYDGSGKAPFTGDVAIIGDRIAYVGARAPGTARRTIDARGLAVSPGFINMLAHPEESLLIDGRAQSDLRQGVTLEIIGEGSMGPLSPRMRANAIARQGDLRYDIDWSTLGGYFERLERGGISMNVASFVGAPNVRDYVLGEGDVQPDATQLSAMKALVHEAMEEGALGVTTALIYAPANYAQTLELAALAGESSRCGGIYSAHMRSEGDRIEAAVQETIGIAKGSGAPAHIYHLKFAGRDNWAKRDAIVAMIETARRSGTRITADMYNYTAGATGFDAFMPPWVQNGGLEASIAHLKDPAVRARVIAEMRDPHPAWENLGVKAGGDGMLLLSFKNDALKPLIGKTLAQVAQMRGKSIEDTAIDLVIEDGTRVGVAYFLMSEANVQRQVQLPWVGYGSDEAAPSIEGVFLKSSNHPRAFGNFARLLARYVRDQRLVPIEDAVRKLTSLPADTLSIRDRGRLAKGYYADVAIFDPATIQDHATFEKPQQYATGVRDVIVNGQLALENGEPTAARPGRAVRGRAWTGYKDGGCRASAKDWTWRQ